MSSPIRRSAESWAFPSSASYILRTLERRGYLRRETETGRCRLGLKILSLGGDAQAHLDIADLALPFMRALVEKIHMTAHLAVLDQGEAVYIEKVEAPGFFKVNTWVGRMFLHSTSVGKCLLAWLPKHEVEALVKRQGLKKRTPKTHRNNKQAARGTGAHQKRRVRRGRRRKQPGRALRGCARFRWRRKRGSRARRKRALTQVDEASMPRIAEALKETARRISR